jgi:hypothetical protein
MSSDIELNVADEIQIRCDLRTEDAAKYSVWTVSRCRQHRVWVGEEHPDALFQAWRLQCSLPSALIIDQVSGSTYTPEPSHGDGRPLRGAA